MLSCTQFVHAKANSKDLSTLSDEYIIKLKEARRYHPILPLCYSKVVIPLGKGSKEVSLEEQSQLYDA